MSRMSSKSDLQIILNEIRNVDEEERQRKRNEIVHARATQCEVCSLGLTCDFHCSRAVLLKA